MRQGSRNKKFALATPTRECRKSRKKTNCREGTRKNAERRGITMIKKNKIPFNLQFFAEPAPESEPTQEPVSQPQEPTQSDKPTDTKTEPKEPTVQELMVELAKVKKAQEKAASEAAEYKKKYNATLSEKEQASIEKAEKEAERESQFQELLRENKINKLEKMYLGMKYTSDEASRMAIAEVDGDLDAKIKVMTEVDARKDKEREEKFLKSRPLINAGVGGDVTVTLDQLNKMSYAKRVEFKRNNPEAYKKLTKMEE